MLDVVITIAEFKNQLKVRGYAESTVLWYSSSLDMFKRYLDDKDIRDIRKVNHQLILDYQEHLMTRPLSIETRATHIRAVKRLFEGLAESHKLLINPTEGIIETSRRNRKIGTVLTLNEVKSLLAQPNLSKPTHIRDRAIIETFYSTGMRLNELISLEVYDVDLKEKIIFIRKGKGNKQRVVPLGKNAAGYIREYIEKVRPRHARKNPRERRLFLTDSGLPLTKINVAQFIRKHRIEAGIKKPASPHTLRRTCATHLLQQGADIRYVQELLGHKDLRTTQQYTKVMPLEVKKVHDNAHPNNREEVPKVN
jgi:integrase/recombinase XerD